MTVGHFVVHACPRARDTRPRVSPQPGCRTLRKVGVILAEVLQGCAPTRLRALRVRLYFASRSSYLPSAVIGRSDFCERRGGRNFADGDNGKREQPPSS